MQFRGCVILFLLLVPFTAISQVKFVNGYYVDNLGTRRTGLIENLENLSRFNSFQFKENAEAVTETIMRKSVKSIESPSLFRFERFRVQVETSSDNNSTLDVSPVPNYEVRDVLLKALTGSPMVLYKLDDTGKTQFYIAQNGDTPTHLLYKRYYKDSRTIAISENYKQALFLTLNCSAIGKQNIEGVSYSEIPLKNLIDRYNKCKEETYANPFRSKESVEFNFSLRPGLTFSNADFNVISDEFGNEAGIRLGLVVEMFLPIARNKWSILLEPTYRDYSGVYDSNSSNSNFNLEYTSIELALGARHYLYPSQNAGIFLSAYVLYDLPQSAALTATSLSGQDFVFELDPKVNMGIGTGFSWKRKWSLEFRYDFERKLLDDEGFNLRFSNISLIAGYTF